MEILLLMDKRRKCCCFWIVKIWDKLIEKMMMVCEKGTLRRILCVLKLNKIGLNLIRKKKNSRDNQVSVQFSHSVVSDSLQPHELQHARSPCPSPTPGVHSDSRPSSRGCHPAISSSVVPFSSCPPIPPSIRVFSNESTLHRGGQSTGVSALASFLPKKSQG